jgi:hypothetical protein
MTTAIDRNVLVALWAQVIHRMGLRGKRWTKPSGEAW